MKNQKKRDQSIRSNKQIQDGAALPSSWEFKLSFWQGLLAVVALGVIIYSNTFSSTFHLDDATSIVENAKIRNLGDLSAMWKDDQSRFVSYLTFALNYHYGELNVWGYHLVNLLIHLLTSSLVGFLTYLLLSSPAVADSEAAKNKKIIAIFCALLFVSHPLATQSVTYIVQRMASLTAMFYLLSLTLYVMARLGKQGGLSRYLLFVGAVVAGLLALFSKENAFTLPFAVILIELFFLQTRQISIKFNDYRILLMLATILATFAYVFSKYSLTIFMPIPPAHGNTYSITPVNYLLTQFSVIIKYIQLLVLPIRQNLDYDYPPSESFFEAKTFLSFILLSGLLALAIYLFNKQRVLSFGIFWFFLTLSIESSIIPIEDLIFEHRTYLPSFGFFLILTTAVFTLIDSQKRQLTMIVLVCIVGINSVLAYQRNKVWKDPITLWTDVTGKSPNKARPFGSLGDAYRDAALWPKAISAYKRSVEINPKYATGQHNLGVAYSKILQWDNAYKAYTDAIEADQKYAKAYYNRGIASYNLEKNENAMRDYSKSIELDSTNKFAYYGRGSSYSRLAQWENAIKDYSKAIEIDSNFVDGYYYRSSAYIRLQQWDKVLDNLNKVLSLDPKRKNALYDRGIAHATLKKWDNAVADYTEAIKLDPKQAPYYINRGVVYGNIGQWALALKDYDQALIVDPVNTIAASNREIAKQNLKTGK